MALLIIYVVCNFIALIIMVRLSKKYEWALEEDNHIPFEYFKYRFNITFDGINFSRIT